MLGIPLKVIQEIVPEFMREENRHHSMGENGDITRESEVPEESYNVSTDLNHSHHSFQGHHQ